MIQGSVTPNREATLCLTLLRADGDTHQLDVIIDTGYTGWLTLSPEIARQLGLSFRRFERARLADGSEVAFSVYDATVLWDGEARVVHVDAVGVEPLVGMSMMDGYRISIDDKDGGAVTIEQLAAP